MGCGINHMNLLGFFKSILTMMQFNVRAKTGINK